MTFLKESTSSKAFDENERTNCRNDLTVQCSDAAANERKKEKKKNEKMINVNKKPTKNVKMKRIVKKKFSKKKKILIQ